MSKEELDCIIQQAHEKSEEISKTLYEFNRMLQRREKSREECYLFLIERQQIISEKYGEVSSFNFLYPEWIFKVPDTYEEYKNMMKEFRENHSYEKIQETSV